MIHFPSERSVKSVIRSHGILVAGDNTVSLVDMGMADAPDTNAAYISPEQVKGRAADTRADIWAFGCVLFEMLSR